MTEPERKKASYVGAPAIFLLELACKQINEAFGEENGAEYGCCFLVGSALERPDWRDVDVRMILDDAAFRRLFPAASMTPGVANWEFDVRWALMTSTISAHLSKITGLPIDFQFQPMTFANERHKKPRNPLGLAFSS